MHNADTGSGSHAIYRNFAAIDIPACEGEKAVGQVIHIDWGTFEIGGPDAGQASIARITAPTAIIESLFASKLWRFSDPASVFDFVPICELHKVRVAYPPDLRVEAGDMTIYEQVTLVFKSITFPSDTEI